MNKRITSILAAGAIAAGLVGGIGACGGGSSSPPNATQILQSNGYTPSSDYTSDFQNGLGSGSSEVSSSEAGTNGNNVQVVIVADNAADASTAVSALNQQYGGDGLSVTQSGDVVTVTGSISTFANIGGS
jgi:hypothetical protein